ncbi:uncharacterized protein LOC132278677 isoform X2 [Cornus florida]|uniref:uncharacterized protein LOC132278677 isoform X2 n=1 Tax=Cornus florida TaxID=4283 RepID=UPI00289B75DD|nr:uncharacterized protein LOC132278677 isoform X2 [Cornus florida]
MEALRVRARALSRDVVWFSLQKFRRFSSSSSTARARARSSFSDDPEGGSSIYRHALKFKPPSTINWQNRYRKALEVLEYPDRPSRWPKYIQQLHNSVSFIGTIDRLRESDCQYGDSGTYTWLTVKTSPDSNRSFEILLNMWDEMAEISIRHLKPNDFIYVSGRLGSYTKVDINGKLETYYQIQLKPLMRNTENAFICGNCSSPTHMSGAIAEKKERKIQIIQILSTSILVKHSGSDTMILHGLKTNSNGMILDWQKVAKGRNILGLVLVYLRWCLMTRN